MRINYPQVSEVLALGTVIFSFNVKVPLKPLQESHIGTIRSPVAFALITCAPSDGTVEHPLTEQDVGHDFFA